MKIGKKLFPYPVIHFESGYTNFKKSSYLFEYQVEKDDDGEFIIFKNTKIELENENLDKFLSEGKVKAVMKITLSWFYYKFF